MHRVENHKTSVDLGDVNEEVVVDGHKAEVTARIATGAHVPVTVSGHKASIELSGRGRVSLDVSGHKAAATVDSALELVKQRVSGHKADITVVDSTPDDAASEAEEESSNGSTETRVYSPPDTETDESERR